MTVPRWTFAWLASAAALAGSCGAARAAASDVPAATARIVAVGIPGIAAVAQVGTFHPGGPIHDKAAFAAFTQPGHILDSGRILVTSTSNFGAPPMPRMPEGSVVSIDPSGTPLHLRADFAKSGAQAIDANGRIMLFAASTADFANGKNTPGAVTAAYPAVSNPLDISINNAFGRLWFPSAPGGARGAGFETISDPDGAPLAGAPDTVAGGVFAAALTGRATHQINRGSLGAGAVANALLGASPDGSKRAVFAVLLADGSLVQVHTERGVDGLARPGTVAAPTTIDPADEDGTTAMATRAGMLLNWVPDRRLFVSEPARDAIAVISLSDDGAIFTVAGRREIAAPFLHHPVDLAPAVSEVANGSFASNTTLAGNSDIYVANRGDGTVARITQDGRLVAERHVDVPGVGVLGPGRLNGIAISSDAQRVWLTISGPVAQSNGAVVEIPAFGSPGLANLGRALFARTYTPEQGLGPLYNETSCVACHSLPGAGGMGRGGLALVSRVGRISETGYDPLLGQGGPVARVHSIAVPGSRCAAAGIPPNANVISLRNAPQLYASGAMQSVSQDRIVAGAVAYSDGVHGRPNDLASANATRTIGRFGWKADVADLEGFIAEAFRNEMGITSPRAPSYTATASAVADSCDGQTVKDDGSSSAAVAAFLASIEAPPRAPCGACDAGRKRFVGLGCAECHSQRFGGESGGEPLYSDLLLHDMGPALDDGVTQGAARGRDWRTTPLFGLGTRPRLLHDGRASTIADAILAHAGEAEHASRAFRALTSDERQELLRFLRSL